MRLGATQIFRKNIDSLVYKFKDALGLNVQQGEDCSNMDGHCRTAQVTQRG